MLASSHGSQGARPLLQLLVLGSPEFLWYYAIRSPPVYTHTFHVSAQAPKSLNTFFGVELEGHEASPSLFSISAYALL